MKHLKTAVDIVKWAFKPIPSVAEGDVARVLLARAVIFLWLLIAFLVAIFVIALTP